MQHCIYNTDPGWVTTLRSLDIADDVNFWRKDQRQLHLEVGSHFYFKERGSRLIVGRGQFRGMQRLTIEAAWERFGVRNGVRTMTDLMNRASSALRISPSPGAEINCILLDNLEWLDVPVEISVGLFPPSTLGARFVEDGEISHVAAAFVPRTLEPAIVLVQNEATIGGEYDHWQDVTGEQYEYPNAYKNLVRPGRRFVYYRGVRRANGRRGQAEYFGCGIIGECWRHAGHGRDTTWRCTIEEYRPFPQPVPAIHEGRYVEPVSRPLEFRNPRRLDDQTYRTILRLGMVGTAEPSRAPVLLSLPDLSAVAPVVVESGVSLLVTTSPTAAVERQPSQSGSSVRVQRRSRNAAVIGRRAEAVVYEFLKRTLPPNSRLRWVADDGQTPGWDIEFNEGSRVIRLEVKGTTGPSFPNIELTANEWAKALQWGNDYRLGLVTHCCSVTPQISFVDNPAALVESGILGVTPSAFTLERLGQKVDGGSPADGLNAQCDAAVETSDY